MSKVGFAIIGLGSIAETHAKVIEQMEDSYLAAVMSRKLDKAKEFASRHGSPHVYDEVEYLLEDRDVDVVVITTPCGAHLDPAEKALRAGKHVIVEKPIEITLERAEQLERVAQEEGVYLTCIFQNRFSPLIQDVKNALSASRFGAISLMNIELKWYRGQSYFDSAPWRGTWDLCGGGVLINQAIHQIDLLLYLAGDPVEVSAYTAMVGHENIEVEDSAVAIMKFKSGALGVIEASTAAYPGAPRRIEINGTKGSICIEDDRIVRWSFDSESEEDKLLMSKYSKSEEVGSSSDPTAVDISLFAMQHRNFLDSIAKGYDPVVTPKEAKRSVALIEAIYKSSREGKRIVLEDMDV